MPLCVRSEEKTVFITFGNYADSVPQKVEIRINGTIIKRVEYCKYLRIIIDYRLNWEKHIEFVRNKTKYLLYVFYKLKQTKSIFVMKVLCFLSQYY